MSQSHRNGRHDATRVSTHVWESSPLTGKQLNAIASLVKMTSERLVPTHIASEEEGRDRQVGKPTYDSEVLDVHSAHQFHQWYTDIESRRKVEADERFRCHLDALDQYIKMCDVLLESADRSQEAFISLKDNYMSIVGRRQALQDECSQLASEKKRLLQFVQVLNEKLEHFEELEIIVQSFPGGLSKVDKDGLIPMLKRLDDCSSFINAHPQYTAYSTYSVKCSQLRSRALSGVRSHVFATLRTAVNLVRQHRVEEKTSTDNSGSPSEGLITPVFYVKFRSAISSLRPLMVEIDSRARLGGVTASKKEYAQVMSDCRTTYCEQRTALVLDFVKLRISDYSTEVSLPAFIRASCSYFLQVCRAERELFEGAFPLESSDVVPTLWTLMEPMGAALHDAIRPRYIALNDVYILAELVDLLVEEIMEEQLGKHGETGDVMRPFVQALLGDIRERLVFRAQSFIKEEVENYRPSDADLDYPGKLEHTSTAAMQDNIATGANVLPEDHADQSLQPITGHSKSGRSHQSWYPPLQSTLSCLAVLYRSLDSRTFSGLAQEAVQICSESILTASRTIMSRTSSFDGQLFAIKHLLVLREQISPFESDLAAHSVPTRELDFSHLRGQMRRMLAGELSLFSTSPDANALIVLAAKGAPRLVESTVDSQRELERHLKVACEAYIMVRPRSTTIILPQTLPITLLRQLTIFPIYHLTIPSGDLSSCRP